MERHAPDPQFPAPLNGTVEVVGGIEHILLADHETDMLREGAEVAKKDLLVEPVDHDAHPRDAGVL